MKTINDMFGFLSGVNVGMKDYADGISKLLNVPNTTKERQDFGGCSCNYIPPKYKSIKVVREALLRNKGKYAAVLLVTSSSGKEAITENDKLIWGEIEPRKYWPSSSKDATEMKKNSDGVTEVYYHCASMNLVFKTKSGKRVGFRSNSFGTRGSLALKELRDHLIARNNLN